MQGVLVELCRCVTAVHEWPLCPQAVVLLIRSAVFAGLYDEPLGRTTTVSNVQLLNPAYAGADPVARRFSLLELD